MKEQKNLPLINDVGGCLEEEVRELGQVIRLYMRRIFELLISSADLARWQQIVSLFFSYPVSVGIPDLCPFAMDFTADCQQPAVRKT